MPIFGGQGQPISMKGAQTNLITLAAGEVLYMNSYQNPSVPGQGTGRAGWFYVKPGRYTAAQVQDPISGVWRGIGDDSNAEREFQTDGVNMRLANQSGCAVGAVVTTAGSGYVTAPTVTASAGASKWLAILGPLVSTAVTIAYGGTNYIYPPIVVIDAPPGLAAGTNGVQASGYSNLTGTAVSSVTIVNQGAGYSGGTPNITLVNDPRDTTGAGAQTVAAVICLDHGNPITSGTVPTLTFGSGSAAATALMNWGITTYAVSTAGQGYGNSAFIGMSAVGPALVATPAYLNPDIQDLLVRTRRADIWVATSSVGALVTGGVINDGGVYRGVPTPIFSLGLAAVGTVGAVTASLGGFQDSSLVVPW
jgi:hypothetical protein